MFFCIVKLLYNRIKLEGYSIFYIWNNALPVPFCKYNEIKNLVYLLFKLSELLFFRSWFFSGLFLIRIKENFQDPSMSANMQKYLTGMHHTPKIKCHTKDLNLHIFFYGLSYFNKTTDQVFYSEPKKKNQH